MENNKSKVIVILGTTASGKTSLGVSLACRFNGEIISADSRQVYCGLDIGSGKDLIEYGDIKYHLIDVADPQNRYSVAQYQRDAFFAIDDILKRGKTPVVVGGSGQYLEAVVENYQLTDIKPDNELREKLENLSTEELFAELEKKNPVFAEKLNNSDKNNKRRLIRYLEINNSPLERGGSPKGDGVCEAGSEYDFLLLGLTYPKEILTERIYKRLIERLEKEGMIQEVSDLHDKKGLSWERLIEFGLEYKFISQYLQEKIDYDQMVELLDRAINQFAKKQITWFRRWEKKRRINWVEDKKEAEKMVDEFLE
ncbi:MAG: tRNA (adenosine(37)-N6)-dimethylallyltransferase MiaA [Patescibacteria group bacterium]|jgi:tRNA dimethylallyltransferase